MIFLLTLFRWVLVLLCVGVTVLFGVAAIGTLCYRDVTTGNRLAVWGIFAGCVFGLAQLAWRGKGSVE